MTNFSAVCVVEKPTTFTSTNPARFPAAIVARFSGRTPYAYRCGPSKRFPRDGFRAYRALDRTERVAWTLRLDGSASSTRADPMRVIRVARSSARDWPFAPGKRGEPA